MSPGPYPFSFRSTLVGAPDFLRYDVPFIERVIVAEVGAEVESEASAPIRKSNIQLVSADSSKTFLRARNSGNTSIAVAPQEPGQQSPPQNNAVPLPTEASVGGNVMVIPAPGGRPRNGGGPESTAADSKCSHRPRTNRPSEQSHRRKFRRFSMHPHHRSLWK